MNLAQVRKSKLWCFLFWELAGEAGGSCVLGCLEVACARMATGAVCFLQGAPVGAEPQCACWQGVRAHTDLLAPCKAAGPVTKLPVKAGNRSVDF